MEWDPDTHDCKFYEAHMKGSYIGNVATDKDGIEFSDAVGALEKVIEGPLAEEISKILGGGLLGASNYKTKFVGVPILSDNPNFQGGADQGRDDLNEPVNLETGVESSYSSQSNRKTITVVGGLLVACFSIAFFLVGYIFYNRRRSYQKSNQSSTDDEGMVEAAVVNLDYDLDKGDSHDYHDDEGGMYHGDDRQEEHYEQHYDEHNPNEPHGEYPNLPMSAEAIQMDLGNTLKGQMMGYESPPQPNSSRIYSPERGDEHDPDESDSWAQTDGTIGSLELQLEPITAEV
jgi:hypothetical protein